MKCFWDSDYICETLKPNSRDPKRTLEFLVLKPSDFQRTYKSQHFATSSQQIAIVDLRDFSQIYYICETLKPNSRDPKRTLEFLVLKPSDFQRTYKSQHFATNRNILATNRNSGFA